MEMTVLDGIGPIFWRLRVIEARFRLDRRKSLRVAQPEIKRQFGIGGRVDGKWYEEIVLLERIDERVMSCISD